MALAQRDRQPVYLRTFFRLLYNWVHACFAGSTSGSTRRVVGDLLSNLEEQAPKGLRRTSSSRPQRQLSSAPASILCPFLEVGARSGRPNGAQHEVVDVPRGLLIRGSVHVILRLDWGRHANRPSMRRTSIGSSSRSGPLASANARWSGFSSRRNASSRPTIPPRAGASARSVVSSPLSSRAR
jgi:hypothetical protein